MDKLEKALEKARHQRQEAAPAASIPRAHAPSPVVINEAALQRNRIVAYRTRSREADVFRILRTQVLQLMNKAGFKTLAVTSPDYGDGKTTIALNLAVSMAQDLKQTVLLVDLDLRKPSVHTYLNMKPTYGLTDYLLHDVPLTDCLTRLPFDRLTVMPSVGLLESSSEMLGSPRMAALADELKSRYADRIIIYDMPPLLTQDDPIAFLPNVDGVLLVIQDGVTKASDVKRCLNALSATSVIGTVLNNLYKG